LGYCPYSEEDLQEWDSVANPMGDACYTCNECECEHWAGSCVGCEMYWKWGECGGPSKADFYYGTEEKRAEEVKK